MDTQKRGKQAWGERDVCRGGGNKDGGTQCEGGMNGVQAGKKNERGKGDWCHS